MIRSQPIQELSNRDSERNHIMKDWTYEINVMQKPKNYSLILFKNRFYYIVYHN